MSDVPIYDQQGIQVDSFYIDDTLEYVNGRVNRGEKCYYKGSGVPYKSHNVLNEDLTEDYKVLEEGLVFYSGSMVSKKCYEGKTGIFQERYGCVFPDWIGTCSSREVQIFENLYDENRFEFNDIECLGWEWIDEDAGQIMIKCEYKSDRKPWTDDVYGLMDLIEYMIQSDWNFPWDKASICDISEKSLVTDVADLFHSSELHHKLGGVYSILYSLGQSDFKTYQKFCVTHGLPCSSMADYVISTLMILQRNSVDIDEVMVGNPHDIYRNIVQNYLVVGKNCGYCGVGSCKGRMDDNLGYGDGIKEQYIKRAKTMLK